MTKLIAAGVAGVATAFGAVAAAPAQAAPPQRVTVDCRTYSGVEVCGGLTLDAKQKQCVRQAVDQGMSERRAEVECSR
ncbi:hypothetical protein [Spirillospora sp. NPDC047279]|uniref:hypothetical protein n=1 Tax=Spirillospora sp. NPDC047279 TaxID=3155478 RepID=UPI0033E1C7CF